MSEPRHPLASRRFAAEAIGLFVLTGLGFALGGAVAVDALGAITELHGLGMVYMAGPSDAVVVRLKLAVAFALPFPVAFVAILVHRLRAPAAPSLARLALYLLTPWLAALAAELAYQGWVGWALASRGTYEADAILAATELAPGSWAMRATMVSGVALWIAAATQRPSEPRPSEG